jgi:hypothetical protein
MLGHMLGHEQFTVPTLVHLGGLARGPRGARNMPPSQDVIAPPGTRAVQAALVPASCNRKGAAT